MHENNSDARSEHSASVRRRVLRATLRRARASRFACNRRRIQTVKFASKIIGDEFNRRLNFRRELLWRRIQPLEFVGEDSVEFVANYLCGEFNRLISSRKTKRERDQLRARCKWIFGGMRIRKWREQSVRFCY